MRLALLLVVACSKPNYPRPTNIPPLPSEPAIADPALRPVGPLSPSGLYISTPWPERQNAMRRNGASYVGKIGMREDLATFVKVMDLYFVPRTQEHAVGLEYRKQHVDILNRLAPYSFDATSNAYISISDRLPFCARPPGERWSCDPGYKPAPVDRTKPAFDLAIDEGVATLTVRDLSATSVRLDPKKLAAAKGIVVDLRGASGSDPSPLVGWLESATGRAASGFLREIRRNPGVSPYVDSYLARFANETRDMSLWRAMVGPPVVKSTPTKVPIVVIVDRSCHSACELVARTLQAYANASVIGAVGKTGRIARDEAAMLVLPHSGVAIFFLATEFLLAEEIEAKTGTTEGWEYRQQGGGDMPAALREVRARIENPKWPPRCDTLAPAMNSPKIHNAFYLTSCHHGAPSVRLRSKAPYSTLQRFFATCPQPLTITGSFDDTYYLQTTTPEVLARVAQSELVEDIQIGCESPPEPNND